MFKQIQCIVLAVLAVAAPLAQAAPVVGWSAPTDNSRFLPPANIVLTATASDTASTIAQVDFFEGANLIGTAVAAPYSITWSNVPTGQYALTAKATSAAGLVTTSTVRTVFVNTPPQVSLTAPAAATSYPGLATVTMNAAASDADGTIAKVDFYRASTLVGTATSAPYSMTMTNVAVGSYYLTAKATDNLGGVTTSPTVLIQVVNPITVALTAPATNARFDSPASITLTAEASSVSSTIANVEFFNGTALLGSTTTAPYSMTWAYAPPGKYTAISVKATDTQGLFKSSSNTSITINTLPTIELTSPVHPAKYATGSTIALQASAGDSDGTVANVQFYRGTLLLANVSTPPYVYNWVNATAGEYTVSAVATDNLGGTATSASAAVYVGINAKPTVAITAPAGNSSFAAPANLTLTATAADIDGTVAKVDFYQGTTLIGTANAAPYSLAWNNVPAGSYSLTAKATDDVGAVSTSAPVPVTVSNNQALTISLTAPGAGQSYFAPATVTLSATAGDSDGSIRQVEFYEGTTLLATTTQAPYTYDWSGVAAGPHTLSARAIDNLGGTTTSNAVTITVHPNQAPAVTLHANPATAAAPGSVMLSADVSDADGTIAQVAFYTGTTLLATVTQAPYAYQWPNIPAGTYSVTARATDNVGATAVSAPVNVTIAQGTTQAYYIHADQLNTPRLVTDSAGHVVWQWDHTDPFGNNIPVANAGFEFNLRFAGQVFDNETGLHYNYFRDYDPSTGRYVQSDPIGLEGGINTYAYVGGNPLIYIDPDGLNPIYERLGKGYDRAEQADYGSDCAECLQKLNKYNEILQTCRESYERYCYNKDGSTDTTRLMKFIQLYNAASDSAAILNCARTMSFQVYGTDFLGKIGSCQKCSLNLPLSSPGKSPW